MMSKVLYQATGVGLLLSWLALELPAGTVVEKTTAVLLLVELVLLPVFVMWTLVLVAGRGLPPKVGLLCGIVGMALTLLGILPGGDGVVAQAVSPDGVEMAVTQKHTGEPYYVTFDVRGRDGGVRSFYYDHEDIRWWRGLSRIRVSEDGRTATVYRTFWPVAHYDLAQGLFTLVRR